MAATTGLSRLMTVFEIPICAKVTASFGIARSDASAGSGRSLQQALSDADAAMYRAKRNGKNRLEESLSPDVGANGRAVHDDVGTSSVRPPSDVSSSRPPIHLPSLSTGSLGSPPPATADRPPAPGAGVDADRGSTYRLPPWATGIGRLIERLGLGGATLVGVIVATAVSVLITVLLMSVIGLPRIPIGIALACVTAPPFSALICWILFSQIEAVAQARAALDRIAHVDVLTQAPTRRYFMENAPVVLARSRTVAIVLFDIDRFKKINDTLGHAFGDTVLRAVSDAASRCLRGGDLFARHGGEEFSVLLPGVTAATALKVAERMRSAIESLALTTEDGRLLPVTASFGVAPEDPHTPPRPPDERLRDGLAAADRALYKAKQGGRNRVEMQGGRTGRSRPCPRRPDRAASDQPGPLQGPGTRIDAGPITKAVHRRAGICRKRARYNPCLCAGVIVGGRVDSSLGLSE